MQAQQKNRPHRANFSGEWKSEQSISMGGNIVCLYQDDDRMRSNTMKIAEEENFLIISSKPSDGAVDATRKEKLSFDGKESPIAGIPQKGKKFSVKWSADGQTMTVNSVIHLMLGAQQDSIVQKKSLFYVTEIWNLGNDGRSIAVQVNVKSTTGSEERSWKTVFVKVL